ncbi:hypothetical protein [Alkalicoccobacillus gibsonii]|nr:hypothetical protein [Alkalicoccobacillus gibsonii]
MYIVLHSYPVQQEDSRINILFDQFSKLVDVTRVMNAEFEMV